MIDMRYESLDTNIVLRALVKDVPNQTVLVDALLKKRLVRFFVSDVAVFESVYTLETYYRLQREQICALLTNFLLRHNIACNHELIQSALTHYRARKSLSYADCYLAASARFMNAPPLWTFDKALAKSIPDAQLVGCQ